MWLQVAATPPKTVLVYAGFRLIQNTDIFGRRKQSWPERSGRDRRNTHAYVVHTSSRLALNGAFTASSVWLKAMLLPDAIPTIFPLSKKAVKAPIKRCFFKARKTRGNWPFSNTPMHNPVYFCAKRHVHTMLTVSVFTAWKHAVIFHINKTSCLILYPGKTNIKTLNLSHYACACFEFF